jgi:hypothetical protein
MSDSDSDSEETITSLLGLLDDSPASADISTPSTRSDFPENVFLQHFSVNENGTANFRDATVLGEHTTIRIPSCLLLSERCKVGIYLNHEVPLTSSSMVMAPQFVSEELKATHRELSNKYPIGNHELWVRTSELYNGIVRFKKRDWELSRGFRKVTGVRWPRFIITVTAFTNAGDELRTSISKDFEVRSKEQSNKARAARGMSEPVRRRRTPETEARAEKLRVIQSEIIAMRDEIINEKTKSDDYTTRFNFMEAMTTNNQEAQNVYILLKNNRKSFKLKE